MPLTTDALSALEKTSRTFFIPISLLPPGLQEAVAAAYLCLRAIDEIEDHPALPTEDKAILLGKVSRILQTSFRPDDFAGAFGDHASLLPEVTLRIGEWATLAPSGIAPRIWDATGAMAERMASWARRGWRIDTVADLDAYTFSVAGSVGVTLCDLCAWHDGGQADRACATACGRGLQAVNILRNRADDSARHVDFFPRGWDRPDMDRYARHHLALVQDYIPTLPACSVRAVCAIPVALAVATLDALAAGAAKLSRDDVLAIVARVGAGL
ncbi:MAG: hypothetical protein NVSMB65_03300 [Chloroflexota bacterium]